jgi:hypothetical protein
MSYYNKYLKYKNKYLELSKKVHNKSIMIGGEGASASAGSGSEKTPIDEYIISLLEIKKSDLVRYRQELINLFNTDLNKYLDTLKNIKRIDTNEYQDTLKILYKIDRSIHMETLIELKRTEINEYISSPEKKILIVGAEPTQHEQFLIPSGYLPMYIETDFGGSISNTKEITTRYESESFRAFPLLLINIENILDKFPDLKFDIIIFDKGVCYWLEILKSTIDYFINLKKPDGVVVFDNKFNMEGTYESKFIENPDAHIEPTNIEPIELSTKPTLTGSLRRIWMEITNEEFKKKYNTIRLIKEVRKGETEYKLEFNEIDGGKHYTIIFPPNYPFASPSIQINGNFFKLKTGWEPKITILKLLEMINTDTNNKLISLVSTYGMVDKNINDIMEVYTSDRLPLIQNIRDINLDYHIEETTGLSLKIFYNWFQIHYPTKTLKIIDNGDTGEKTKIIKNELATNNNLILLSDVNIYHRYSRNGTRAFNIYIYIK